MNKEGLNKLNKCYFSDDMHEKVIIELLPILLKGKKHFVDIGASLGQYTYFANNCMENGLITCIEADKSRIDDLKCNCTDWEKQSSNKINSIYGANFKSI